MLRKPAVCSVALEAAAAELNWKGRAAPATASPTRPTDHCSLASFMPLICGAQAPDHVTASACIHWLAFGHQSRPSHATRSPWYRKRYGHFRPPCFRMSHFLGWNEDPLWTVLSCYVLRSADANCRSTADESPLLFRLNRDWRGKVAGCCCCCTWLSGDDRSLCQRELRPNTLLHHKTVWVSAQGRGVGLRLEVENSVYTIHTP